MTGFRPSAASTGADHQAGAKCKRPNLHPRRSARNPRRQRRCGRTGAKRGSRRSRRCIAHPRYIATQRPARGGRRLSLVAYRPPEPLLPAGVPINVIRDEKVGQFHDQGTRAPAVPIPAASGREVSAVVRICDRPPVWALPGRAASGPGTRWTAIVYHQSEDDHRCDARLPEHRRSRTARCALDDKRASYRIKADANLRRGTISADGLHRDAGIYLTATNT